MNKYLANIVSVAFHPLLASTYTFGLLLFLFPSSLVLYDFSTKASLLAAIFLMTFLVPASSTYFLVRSDVITSMTLSNQKERNSPLLFTFITYLITTYFCYKNISQDLTFTFIMGFMSLVILSTYLVNFFWKISAHAAGIGGVLAYFFTFLTFDNSLSYLPYFLVLIFICGFVLSARISLEEHTKEQAYAGLLLGFGITYMIKIFI